MAESVRLKHVVPASAVGTEEARIAGALADGGYDATGLDLVPLAKAAVARDLIAKVRAAGAHILSAPWGVRGDGGVEIEFELVGDGDQMVAKMALAD